MSETREVLRIKGVAKSFTLHQHGGTVIPVLNAVDMCLEQGDAIALAGPSGAGKSTLMRMVYGNYHCPSGQIQVMHGGRWVDMAGASARTIIDVRRRTVGHISQFLRVIPRVATLDIVAEPLRARGTDRAEAERRASDLLARLNIPERLWPLSPVTFSGGEQQRVNIARGFVAPYPLLLLDEPTSSLDAANRDVVIGLIGEARGRGTAILGIFHDDDVRERVCDGVYPMGTSVTAH